MVTSQKPDTRAETLPFLCVRICLPLGGYSMKTLGSVLLIACGGFLLLSTRVTVGTPPSSAPHPWLVVTDGYAIGLFWLGVLVGHVLASRVHREHPRE